MRFDWNSIKALKKKRDNIVHALLLSLLVTMFFLFGKMPSQAAPIIDTTMVQTGVMPGTPTLQTAPAQNVTNVRIVSTPGSGSTQIISAPGNNSTQMTSIPVGTSAQVAVTTDSAAVQTVQTSGISSGCTTISTGVNGVGELWMLGSATGAQNLSIVIKSPNGKLVVIDGGWEADADKLSSLIQQQGGKVDAWLITHPHEDHVGALCAILNDSSRKIKIDKIYCSLAAPDWYRQVSPTGAGIADQLLNAFTKLSVGTVKNNISRGTEINIDDVNIRVLNNRGVYTYNGVNNSSMVYKIRVSGQSILILGDLAYDGGKDLIKTCTAAELKSDIVQMAHHGQQGVDQDAYALIAPTTCLWPSPAWLWNNDNGGGVGSGPWGTLTTRAWMDALGVKDNRSLKDGDVHMYLGMPSPNM